MPTDYDNIGNRRMAIEGERYSLYRSNPLNQYTGIMQGRGAEEPETFAPEFDLDGNQTKVQTATGIWNIEYNAENRPILFTRTEEDGTETQVACTYDSMGRRTTHNQRHRHAAPALPLPRLPANRLL